MNLIMLPVSLRVYLTFVTVLLGLVMGSALNCLSWRIAHNEKWSGGRSRCPKCGHVLGVLDLVPLFSWLLLKGKCRYCGEKISARYPITEAVLALCYALLLWRFGLTVRMLSYVILCSCLFCLSLVDLETQIIPDRFLVIPAAVQIVLLLLEGGLSGLLRGLWPALALGGGVLALSLFMDHVLKKESMGGGDIKLLFVLGLYFDFPCCLVLLIFACAIGLVFALALNGKEAKAFPFGPALSLGAFFTLLLGQPIVNCYLGLFH